LYDARLSPDNIIARYASPVVPRRNDQIALHLGHFDRPCQFTVLSATHVVFDQTYDKLNNEVLVEVLAIDDAARTYMQRLSPMPEPEEEE
jgi:hypothetical protein